MAAIVKNYPAKFMILPKTESWESQDVSLLRVCLDEKTPLTPSTRGNLTIINTNKALLLISSFFTYTLRESISRGYPFFFVKKGHKYVFYSVSSKHLSSYSNIN